MMKKRTLIMSALAVTLAAGMTIAPALAYFTDHTEATGSIAIELGDKTEIHETVDDWTKTVTISNEGPESVYVRAKGIAGTYKGAAFTLDYSDSDSTWVDGEDGWYYFNGVVDANGETDKLVINIGNIPKDEDVEDGDELNVTVVYECVKLIYNEEGKSVDKVGKDGKVINSPQEADWSMPVTVTK